MQLNRLGLSITCWETPHIKLQIFFIFFSETVDKTLLKTRSGEFDLESIHSVSLKDLGIIQILAMDLYKN